MIGSLLNKNNKTISCVPVKDNVTGKDTLVCTAELPLESDKGLSSETIPLAMVKFELKDDGSPGSVMEFRTLNDSDKEIVNVIKRYVKGTRW